MATSSTLGKMLKYGIQNEIIDEIKEEDVSDDSLQQSSMSLDVLARVATETLERSGSEDSSSSKPVAKPKKAKKVTRGTSDVMTLEQIRMLSDKVLVNTFAELSSDEIKRKYTYRCWLVPESCQEQFSSFGNEMKARQCVKAHLLAHIGNLLQEESHAGKGTEKFTAEPINVRKRRLAGNARGGKRRKRTTSGSKSPTSNYMARITAPVTTYTAIKTRKKLTETMMELESEWSPSPRKKSGAKRSKNAAAKKAPVEATIEETVIEEPAELVESLEMFQMRTRLEEEVQKMQEEEEKANVVRLSTLQPFMDHSYTTVCGPRVIVEPYGEGPQFEQDDVDQPDEGAASNQEDSLPEDKGRLVTIQLSEEAGGANSNSLHVPVIRMAKMPVSTEWTPAVGSEEVVHELEADQQLVEGHFVPTNARPYPPMPKSDNSKTGKLLFPEEYTSSDDDMPAPPKGIQITNRKKKASVEGTTEWERKMALKCIRELRCQRKQDVSLVCKICQDKAFTATATLMYHYRSHAGIKPFVCLICNTTFTRQHSLNYHMLIHNNQSRFMCPDCGRKFRHPSHYKEHRRRHTGETPFHCMDCPLRFKTRNTYKRHLKTRHGKLLTAEGIQYLTYDERTKSTTNAQRQVRYRGIQANQEGIVLVEGMEDEAFYNEMEEDDTIDNLDDEDVYIEEIEETAIENLE